MKTLDIGQLQEQGYQYIGYKKGRGYCGVKRFIYTVGLVYNITEHGYKGRYCYPDYESAVSALLNWSGEGDPLDEDWIKHKGKTEYSNEKHKHLN